MNYVARTIESSVRRLSDQFPILLVTGARQVGKSTVLKHLAGGNRTYVSLDDPAALSLAREEPKLFLQKFPPPLLIDEIQYAPQLFPVLKLHVDSMNRNGEIWLSGSQQFHLMKGVSESLAGRVCIMALMGLSLFEQSGEASSHRPFTPEQEVCDSKNKLRPKNLNETYAAIWRGSFPALALDQNKDRNAFYSSYIQTYLQRDLRDLTHVGNELTFLKFLKAAAARSGQLLNIAELSKDADISPTTGKAWLSILESSGIIYLLAPYHNNITNRVIKTPKLYFMDTGLCSYLTGWSSSETLESGAMSGAILETFVVTEIIKSYLHNALTPPIYYYRDKDMKEIDVIILKDQTLYPIEIKKTSAPSKSHIRDFGALAKLGLQIGRGALICFTDMTLPITETDTAIPVHMI